MSQNELYHHGIAGQKWGVQNGPPYPLDSKTHNNVVKKAGEVVKKIVRPDEETKAKRQAKAEEREARRVAKKQRKADRAAAKEQTQKEKNEKLKQEILTKGDLKACSKHSELFSNEEIAEVVYRNATLTKLSDLANPVKAKEEKTPTQQPTKEQQAINKINEFANKSPKEKVDKAVNAAGNVINTAKKLSDYAKTGVEVYNTVAKIANATGQANMKVIELDPKKDNTTTSVIKTFDTAGNLVQQQTSTTKDGNSVKEIRNYKPETETTKQESQDTQKTEVKVEVPESFEKAVQNGTPAQASFESLQKVVSNGQPSSVEEFIKKRNA